MLPNSRLQTPESNVYSQAEYECTQALYVQTPWVGAAYSKVSFIFAPNLGKFCIEAPRKLTVISEALTCPGDTAMDLMMRRPVWVLGVTGACRVLLKPNLALCAS